MRSLLRFLPSKADYPRLALWMFCTAWLVGSIALIIGLNGDAGEIPAICIFAIACVMWWGAYRVRGKRGQPANAIGFLALAIWILNLLGAFVFDSRQYVTDLFFWASAAMLLLLIISASLSKTPYSVRKS